MFKKEVMMRWILLFVLFSVLLQGQWKEAQGKEPVKVEVLPPRIDSIKTPPRLPEPRYSLSRMIRRYAEVTGDWEKVKIDSTMNFWYGRLDGMVKMADCIVKGTVVKVEEPSPDSLYNACVYLLVEKAFKGCKEGDTIKVKLAYPDLPYGEYGIIRDWRYAYLFHMFKGKQYFLFLWKISQGLLRCRTKEKCDSLLLEKIWDNPIVPDGYEPMEGWNWLILENGALKRLAWRFGLRVKTDTDRFVFSSQLEDALKYGLKNKGR